jgi:PAS domain-containing protein
LGIIHKKRAEEELLKKNDELAAANEELTAIETELRQKYEEISLSEQYLRDSERKLLDIINFAPDPTFAIDSDGKIIAWNKAIEELTGVKAKDVMGKGNYEYSIPIYGYRRPIFIDLLFSDEPDDKHGYSRVLKEGHSITTENWQEFKDLGKRLLWIKASPLYDEKGKLAGAIESIRDITNLNIRID